MRLKQSTGRNKLVFMTDSADHVTGKTGLTLTITASKDGASFSSITPTVTDLGSGWYNLALTTTHTNTVGDFALHVTATGADPTDVLWEVESNDQFTANPQTGDSFARLGAPAGASVSADIAAIEAQTDDIGVAGAGLTALASASDLSALTSYVDTEVAAIKAKTDSLTFSVAGQVDANVKYVNDAQIQGNGQSGTEWGPV